MRKTADWTKGVTASHRGGRGGSLGKPQFTYSVEVPGPLEGKSLFETHCSLLSDTPAAHRQIMCVCVQTHTWTFPTQISANHVCTSRGEGKRGREKFDMALDKKREEEGKGGWEGGKKDFLTLQLSPWQPARQYLQPLPQWHEGIRWIKPPLFIPLRKNPHSSCQNHIGLPPSFVSSWGTLPLLERETKYPVSLNWNQMNFV